MQVFRVTVIPRSDSDWSDDPYEWARRLIVQDRDFRERGRATTLECGIELPSVDGVERPRTHAECEEFAHAIVWLGWLLLHGCVAGYIMTIDNYCISSILSNWVAWT
ncbi:hypothetical protein IT415_02485 [bacterium]|nr:hypothetical protein [bacterium]